MCDATCRCFKSVLVLSSLWSCYYCGNVFLDSFPTSSPSDLLHYNSYWSIVRAQRNSHHAISITCRISSPIGSVMITAGSSFDVRITNHNQKLRWIKSRYSSLYAGRKCQLIKEKFLMLKISKLAKIIWPIRSPATTLIQRLFHCTGQLLWHASSMSIAKCPRVFSCES